MADKRELAEFFRDIGNKLDKLKNNNNLKSINIKYKVDWGCDKANIDKANISIDIDICGSKKRED